MRAKKPVFMALLELRRRVLSGLGDTAFTTQLHLFPLFTAVGIYSFLRTLMTTNTPVPLVMWPWRERFVGDTILRLAVRMSDGLELI